KVGIKSPSLLRPQRPSRPRPLRRRESRLRLPRRKYGRSRVPSRRPRLKSRLAPDAAAGGSAPAQALSETDSGPTLDPMDRLRHGTAPVHQSDFTLAFAAFSAVRRLRSGSPNTSDRISNTSPLCVLTPSLNDRVAVPK